MKRYLTLFLLFFIIDANSTINKIDKLNFEIKKNNGNWIAKETSVSHFSKSELKKLLGSQDIPNGHGLYEVRNAHSNDSFDWRNANGINWLGPIMNQGNCGSCVAFAAVATLEAQYRINSGLPWLTPNFSPQYLFSCGGGYCDFGWRPGSAARTLKTKGIVDSACSPYTAGSTGTDIYCSAIKCENLVERTFKIADYNTPSFAGGTSLRVKEALKKGPMMTTMQVYEDFLSYGGGIYKNVSQKKVGGHAVSLIGFNDQERYWIIRNSWGDDWGEKGFARISYDDDSGIADDTWLFELNKVTNYLEVISPKNHDYISGEMKIETASLKSVTSEITIKGNGEELKLNLCEETIGTKCQGSLDTNKLSDGRYELILKADNHASITKEIFVINHQPVVAIHFEPTENIDLEKPLSKRIEFNIDIKANPVMPSLLRFIIEDSSGKRIAERTTDVVLPEMKLGFRFNTIPSGKYKIYYQTETPFQGQISLMNSNFLEITTQN